MFSDIREYRNIDVQEQGYLALFLPGLRRLRFFPGGVVSAYSIAEGRMLPGDFKVTKYVSHFSLRIALIKEPECS